MKKIIIGILIVLSSIAFAQTVGMDNFRKADEKELNTYSILKTYFGIKTSFKFNCDNIQIIKAPATKEGFETVIFPAVDELRLYNEFFDYLDDGILNKDIGGNGLYVVYFIDDTRKKIAIVFGFTDSQNKTYTFMYGECFYKKR